MNKDVDAIYEYIGQTYFRNEDGSSVDMTTYLSADEVIAEEGGGMALSTHHCIQ